MIFIYRLIPYEKFEYISPSSINLNGFTPEEHYSNPELLQNLVHLEDYPVFEFWKNFPTLSRQPIVMRWVRKDGKIIWTEHRYSCIIKNNKIYSVIGFIKDITIQKETEFALRENEEKYRELFEHANDFIFLLEHKEIFNEFIITEINETAKKCFFKDDKNNYKIKMIDIIDKEYITNFKDLLKDIELKKMTNFESIFIDKNYNKLNIDINASFFKFKGRKSILIIARDITEKRKTEYEIQKNQKLESLAILSGGIAHDFNNLLTAILGNVSLIRYNNKENNIGKGLEEVEKIILKAKNLTQELLSFSKSDLSNKRTDSIAKLLKETSTFISTGSTVKCEFSIDKNLKLVDFDETQMVLVIDNLILNSIQAMDNGGIINISAKNQTIKNHKSLTSGNYVEIKIADSGCGILKENIEKIFDPFFTTKTKGTGLGLTSTYSIIKRHGGIIEVDSEIGKGSVFTILLPESKEKNLPEKNISTVQIKTGKGNILLMDDNSDIRNVTKKIIEHLGYKVETASDGDEAIKKYNDAKINNSPYDLVILDLTIQGGMGGKDTIKELKNIDKDIKALISTGYSSDPVVTEFKSYGFCDIINKPYTVESISNILYKYISK